MSAASGVTVNVAVATACADGATARAAAVATSAAIPGRLTGRTYPHRMYAGKHGRRRRHDGSNRRPVQAQGLRLPVLGDLRGRRINLRLRPLRRAPEEQRQGAVVEGDAAG